MKLYKSQTKLIQFNTKIGDITNIYTLGKWKQLDFYAQRR